MRLTLENGVLLILIAACSAVAALGATGDSPPFDVAQWLRGPDRCDFPWKVKAFTPQLTMQQRYLVQIRATIDVHRLQAGALERDLHFVMKVADAHGLWFSGQDYNHLLIPPQIDRSQEILYASGLYLRPGRYTIALIAYDIVLKQGNVWRKLVKVPRPKRDPLPELDRNVPDVEFISEMPRNVLNYNQSLGIRVSSVNDVWPLGHGREWLPVKSSSRLRIEIVVNTSAYNNPYRRNKAAAINYPVYSLHLLQVASVLSNLRPPKGCVRVSMLDTLRMKTLFDREDAESFDWQRASEVVAKQDQVTINASLLRSRTKASAYLLDVLLKIMADSGCASGAEPPLIVIIVVSRELLFAEHTRIERVIPLNPASTRFFYFSVASNIVNMGDDLFKMLKPAKPQRYFIMEPRLFRNALAALISSLERHK